MTRPPVVLITALVGVLAIGVVASANENGRHDRRRVRTVTDSFPVTAIPFPVPEGSDPLQRGRGCSAGTEGLHWDAQEFEARASGRLIVSIEADGDWDIFLLDGRSDSWIEGSSSAQEPWEPSDETITRRLSNGERIRIGVCNWLGSKDAIVHYTFYLDKAATVTIRDVGAEPVEEGEPPP